MGCLDITWREFISQCNNLVFCPPFWGKLMAMYYYYGSAAIVSSTPLLAPRIGLYTASLVSLKDALIGWSASDYDAPIQLWRIQINTGYTLPSPTARKYMYFIVWTIYKLWETNEHTILKLWTLIKNIIESTQKFPYNILFTFLMDRGRAPNGTGHLMILFKKEMHLEMLSGKWWQFRLDRPQSVNETFGAGSRAWIIYYNYTQQLTMERTCLIVTSMTKRIDGNRSQAYFYFYNFTTLM